MEEVKASEEIIDTQAVPVADDMAALENQVLEQALNDLKTSYNTLTDLLTKMNGTAVRKVFMAAVSYPLDNEILSKVLKREEDVELFTHARTCILASTMINNIMMKREEVRKQLEAINNQGETNGTEEASQ